MGGTTDESAVTDLLFLYSELVDTRSFDRLGEVYTSDAEVDLGFGTWRSIDAIVEAYRGLLADVAGSAHAVSNVRVRLDGDAGRSTAYVQAWHWMRREDGESPDQPADFLFVALYIDDLVRTPDAGWQIARRRARRVGPTALAVGTVPPDFIPASG